MRYYTYVSGPKVAMLYSQLPIKEIRRVSAELKVNIGVVEATIGKPESGDDVYTKLDIVRRHLERQGQVGTCERPLAFFQGTLEMHFGDVSFYRGGGRMILFSGLSLDGTRVGLVGSTAHVVGAPSMEPESLGYARAEFWLELIESMDSPSEDQFGNQMYDLDNMIDYQASRRRDAPKQKVEFLAKKFILTNRFLVGSPLYVAMAE